MVTEVFGGEEFALTIVNYADGCIICLGTRGLLGTLYQIIPSSHPTPTIDMSYTLTTLLGDRDDLASSILAGHLYSNILRPTLSKSIHRIVLSLSIPRHLIADKALIEQLTQWLKSSIIELLK